MLPVLSYICSIDETTNFVANKPSHISMMSQWTNVMLSSTTRMHTGVTPQRQKYSRGYFM